MNAVSLGVIKTPMHDEIRCYVRDPDGYIIEVGQTKQVALPRFE